MELVDQQLQRSDFGGIRGRVTAPHASSLISKFKGWVMGRPKGKLSKGQPKGARSASGRKRERAAQSLTPCEGVVRRRELYRLPANDTGEPDASDRRERRGRQETDTCDAIGRAYCAGLLGGGELADRRLQAARTIAARYWSILGFATPDSLARFQPQQPSGPRDEERDARREQALNDGLALIAACGRDVRVAFDHLVIDPNPDQGPPWLDAIVAVNRCGGVIPERYSKMLERALVGLDALG